MTLEEIMGMKTFAIAGDTLDPRKYAWKIRHAMEDAGYQVYAVGKELPSLNDIPTELDIIDLCMHPKKALPLLQENRKAFRCILIQPGAEDEELISWLTREQIPFLRGCLLEGLRLYR